MFCQSVEGRVKCPSSVLFHCSNEVLFIRPFHRVLKSLVSLNIVPGRSLFAANIIVQFSPLTIRTWYPVCISESCRSDISKKRIDIFLLQGIAARVTNVTGNRIFLKKMKCRVNSLLILMQLIVTDRLINAASTVSNHCLDGEYFVAQTYDIVDNDGSK